MVYDFVTLINKNIINDVTDTYNENTGWDEFTNIPSFGCNLNSGVETGWEKYNKSLDLEPSLYESPHNHKDIVYLLDINNVEKYKTDFETKYLIICILGKKNIIDKMVLKLSFVIKPNCSSNNNNKILFIEEVNVYGFLTFNKDYECDVTNNYYQFNDLMSGEITNDKEIISQLIDVQQKKINERNKRLQSLDRYDKEFIYE